MSWSLRHSFHAYSAQQDSQRAQALTTTLADFYEDNQSWDFIRNNPRLWRDIVRPDIGRRELTPEQLKREIAFNKKNHIKVDADVDEFVIKNDSKKNMDNTLDHKDLNYLNHKYNTAVPRRPSHWSLLDEAGLAIAGNPNVPTTAIRYPIIVKGNTVGWIAIAPRERRVTQGEKNFLSEQRQSSVYIMISATLLAIVAALLLARLFLAPVRRLADATQQLIAGQYDTRAQVQQQDELGQLAKDFNHLAATLQRNEVMRRDFVADISHELRTPLAILKGEIEAIQDGIRKPDAAAMMSLQNETQALSQLVDDLYQISLSDVGGLHYSMSPTNLNECITRVADAFQERLVSKRLTWKLALPESVIILQADERRLAQLFKNLLQNTLRYTDPNGQVELNVTNDQRHIFISLQDSAPGVSDEELPKIFERLYRVESSRNRATGGAGLGLPLCQTIVNAHGGQIHAQHSPLGGVQINITLPLHRA
jgi:two-component system sensor histidine kinase BaeS